MWSAQACLRFLSSGACSARVVSKQAFGSKAQASLRTPYFYAKNSRSRGDGSFVVSLPFAGTGRIRFYGYYLSTTDKFEIRNTKFETNPKFK
jgi:hypothetical protein